jgi:hypothetical protein
MPVPTTPEPTTPEHRKAELAKEEDRAWSEFMGVVASLTEEQILVVGYDLAGGWSVKDLIAHIGCWLAEADCMLERIREGTYREDPLDTDARNREFFEANHDLAPGVVRAECSASRSRALIAWDALPEVTEPAEEWFTESTTRHYAEHLPSLVAWADELRSRR